MAAVAKIQLDGSAWKTWTLTSRDWQREAWRLYDITGQLRFVVNSIAAMASKARLEVVELDETGEPIGPVEDPAIAALAAVPLGTGEERAENIRMLAINLQAVGEAYIVAEGTDDGADRWFIVSTEKISRVGDDVIVRRPAIIGGGHLNLREDIDRLYRVWTPHPADLDEPDSPTRSAIPDLRELEVLRKREFAELDSRLAGAGVLAMPSEMDFPEGDDETPGGVEGVLADVVNAMAESLQDRSSAKALAPIGVTGPAEVLDKIRHITFWTELSDQILPMKESALRSVAQSLDAPVEMMQGMGDTNHWSAWLLDEQTISTHVEPLLARIADALTRGYLQDSLEWMGHDPRRFSYRFSTEGLSTRGDRTPTALELHRAGVLSDAALLRTADFDEEDVPDRDETLRRLMENAVRQAPSMALADPEIRRIIGLPGAPVSAPGVGAAPIPAAPPAQTEDGPPVRPSEPPADEAALLAVCHLAVLRAMELAGGRLVPQRPRDVPRHELHCRLPQPPAADRARWALNGAWAHLPAAVRMVGINDLAGLEDLLNRYALELLTRGVPHHPDLLAQVLARALAGIAPRGLP